jgi:transposase
MREEMNIQNKISTPKTSRKKYSPQFKDMALERAAKDGIPQISKDLGIPDFMLYAWRAKHQQGGDSLENLKLQQAEFAKLKREITRLNEENSFLKKAAAYFAKESR